MSLKSYGPRVGASTRNHPSVIGAEFGVLLGLLPRGQLQLGPISVSQWTAALRRYKPRAARGSDGFSHLDLLKMLRQRCQELLDFLHALEQGQVMAGAVAVGVRDGLGQADGVGRCQLLPSNMCIQCHLSDMVRPASQAVSVVP